MKLLLLPLAGAILLASCNDNSSKTAGTGDSSATNTVETAVDPATAKADITTLVDNIHNGFRQKDQSLIEKSMTSDALFIGTDPKEVWPYSQFRDSLKKFFADTSFHGLQYDIPSHQIEIHGNSAIIIDQYQLNEISRKVMIRNLGHARYENGKWLLDLYSFNLAPKNEDLAKIEKAL